MFDRTGWVDRNGRFLIAPDSRTNDVETVTWNEFYAHYARVQQALVPERPALNIFLFVGPNERPEEAVRNLTTAARRNGGTFQLLTTKRLEEIRARADAEAAK
ncbi:MAG: hypothetical protein MUE42_12640 [Opitutaceae bacterium]|nr:hypothetical protein [Opitutaceae bacterium]